MKDAPSIATPVTNRLNVYLIKDVIVDADHATKMGEDPKIQKKQIDDVGTFYFKQSSSNTPDWVTRFFINTLSNELHYFNSSSASGLLIVSVKIKSKKKLFAIPFGTGRFLLRDEVCEERFGLRTSLNMLSPDGLRSMGKRTLAHNPKVSVEQVSKAGIASDFQIDVEKDIINSITGNCAVSDFGKIITGKDSLSVSYKIDITNVVDFCRKCYDFYIKDSYKASFDWIDHIKELKSSAVITKLETKLIKLIENRSKDVWLSPPVVIDWADFYFFRYSAKKSDNPFEELDITDFLNETKLAASLTIDDLRSNDITCWRASKAEFSYKWRVYSCLNAEIVIGRSAYLLDAGKWYEINKDFVSKVDAIYKTIPWIDLGLPPYTHTTENEYNRAIAPTISGHCLDAKNINHGGGYSKIEFCDVISDKNELLYVKKYSGSATLSHLFAQGFVSCELLLKDDDFKRKVIALLPASAKSIIPVSPINPNQFKVNYVIISKKKKKMNLPFLSKVNLKNFYQTLRYYGYDVRLCHVENNS